MIAVLPMRMHMEDEGKKSGVAVSSRVMIWHAKILCSDMHPVSCPVLNAKRHKRIINNSSNQQQQQQLQPATAATTTAKSIITIIINNRDYSSAQVRCREPES